MIGRITAIIFFVFLVLPSFAGEKGKISFTNEDLEKYRGPSGTKTPVESRPPSKTTEATDNAVTKQPAVKEPKRYVIPYKVSEGTEMRVILPVTFNNDITGNMLLDTGATGMHISSRLAVKLGIFESNEVKLLWFTGGIGGTVPAVITIIDSIKIGDVNYQFIPTTVSDSDFEHFEGLIGMDFMTNYSVHIDTVKHEVAFEELPESSKMHAGRTETWWRVTFQRFRAIKSAWKQYRDRLYAMRNDTSSFKELQSIVDNLYNQSDRLLTRLDVYASTHSVPQEWR
jgi:hypothetical protein